MPNTSNPQSWNRYTYCLNNPLKYVDPTGFFEDPAIDAIFGDGTSASLQEEDCDRAWYNMLRDAHWGDVFYYQWDGGYAYYEFDEGQGAIIYTAVQDGQVLEDALGEQPNIVGLAQQTNQWKQYGEEFRLTLFPAKRDGTSERPVLGESKGHWHIQKSWFNRNKEWVYAGIVGGTLIVAGLGVVGLGAYTVATGVAECATVSGGWALFGALHTTFAGLLIGAGGGVAVATGGGVLWKASGE